MWFFYKILCCSYVSFLWVTLMKILIYLDLRNVRIEAWKCGIILTWILGLVITELSKGGIVSTYRNWYSSRENSLDKFDIILLLYFYFLFIYPPWFLDKFLHSIFKISNINLFCNEWTQILAQSAQSFCLRMWECVYLLYRYLL